MHTFLGGAGGRGAGLGAGSPSRCESKWVRGGGTCFSWDIFTSMSSVAQVLAQAKTPSLVRRG